MARVKGAVATEEGSTAALPGLVRGEVAAAALRAAAPSVAVGYSPLPVREGWGVVAPAEGAWEVVARGGVAREAAWAAATGAATEEGAREVVAREAVEKAEAARVAVAGRDTWCHGRGSRP